MSVHPSVRRSVGPSVRCFSLNQQYVIHRPPLKETAIAKPSHFYPHANTTKQKWKTTSQTYIFSLLFLQDCASNNACDVLGGDNRHSFGLQLSRCSSLYVILDKDDIRHTTFESAFFAILRFKTYDSASERSAESKPRGIS